MDDSTHFKPLRKESHMTIRTCPRRDTISFIRQFAAAYVNFGPAPLGQVVLN